MQLVIELDAWGTQSNHLCSLIYLSCRRKERIEDPEWRSPAAIVRLCTISGTGQKTNEILGGGGEGGYDIDVGSEGGLYGIGLMVLKKSQISGP